MASLDFEIEKNAFRDFYGLAYPKLEAAADSFRALVASLLSANDDFSSPVVTSRVKDREESIKKFARKYQTNLEEQHIPYEIKDHITDIIGLRVTCYYETDISFISKILENNFNVLDVTDKTTNLEIRDDTFGYKGLHFDLKLNQQREGLPEYSQIKDMQFEIQIRTIIQHAWSELDHKIKYKKSPPPSLKRKINRLAALFELADQEFINIKLDTDERERQLSKTDLDSQLISNNNELREVTHKLSELFMKFSEKENKFLDAFQFLAVANNTFPNYDFTSYKVDGFVQDILRIDPLFTQSRLVESLNEHLETVQAYADFRAADSFLFNPYTKIRHTLYLTDKKKFAQILFDRQRQTFDSWLNGHKSKTSVKTK